MNETLEHCIKVYKIVGLILPSVITCLGIIGTFLSLIVLPRMRYFIGRIESFLLISLSIADMLVLVLQALRIGVFEHSFATFSATSATPQRAIRRILLTVYFIETWIIVLIAINRFIALCFPFYRGRLSTPLAAKLSVACVVIISIALNAVDFTTFDTPFSSAHSWTTLKPDNGVAFNVTTPSAVSEALATKKSWSAGSSSGSGSSWSSSGGSGAYGSWNGTSIWKERWYINYVLVVERMLMAFIPCLLILVLDIAMVSVLIKMQKTRTHLTMEKGSSGNPTAIAILLSVAISYVCINLPYHAFVIHVWYVEKSGDYCKYVKMALNLAMIINCSINFVLYFLLSSTFRKTLGKTCRDCRKCRCKGLNVSRDDADGPNKLPLIFFSKQSNTTKPTEVDDTEGKDSDKGPIYRPVPKPRNKKAKNTNSNSSNDNASPVTSALIMSNEEV